MARSPRWLESINKALSHPDNKGQVIYQVATVDARGTPHVRSQVHRGFLNPDGSPHLPLLLTSTDIRASKVIQLRENQRVELAWWMQGSQDQFRIAGIAHIVPHPSSAAGPTPLAHPETLAIRRLTDAGFDWEAQRRELFEKMSPKMRASWCVPNGPGTQMSAYAEAEGWPRQVPGADEAEGEDDRRNREEASKNFGLMVVEPIEVDWVQLGVEPNRRTLFKRMGEDAGWIEQIVVP